MRNYIVLLLVLLLVVPCFAQENLGARPMGMGGAFVGLADDANAIFSNPAGLGSQAREATLIATRVSEGREYTMIGGVEITPAGNIGVGYVGSSDPVTGSDLSTDWSGDSPVKYNTQTLYLTYARELNRVMRVPDNMGNLSVGLNVKFSSRKLATAKGLSRDGGSNIDVDLASVFKLNKALSLGASVRNFMSGEKTEEIPNLSTVEQRKFGLSLGASGKILDESITWSVTDDEVGCEWQVVKGLALRAGKGKDCTTSGIGINLGGLGIDYAYLQKDSPVQYWSISLIPQETPKKAEVKQAGLNIE
jgi:hypothetical protein